MRASTLFELRVEAEEALPGSRDCVQDPVGTASANFPFAIVGLLGLTVLNTSGNVVWARIGLCRRQVEVLRSSGRVKGKVWVHIRHLASVRAHASGCLAGLDVAPDHRSHVTLVVHEACVKVRNFIRIGGRDVSRATGEWVFLTETILVNVTKSPGTGLPGSGTS